MKKSVILCVTVLSSSIFAMEDTSVVQKNNTSVKDSYVEDPTVEKIHYFHMVSTVKAWERAKEKLKQAQEEVAKAQQNLIEAQQNLGLDQFPVQTSIKTN